MLPDGVQRVEGNVMTLSPLDPGMLALEIDKGIFSIDAMLKGAYKFY